MDNLHSFPKGASPDDFLSTLFRPSAAYEHPSEVLRDDDLTLYEKRSILASWASDACTVESTPSLRAPAMLSRPVSIDEILQALRELDADLERRAFADGRTDPT